MCVLVQKGRAEMQELLMSYFVDAAAQYCEFFDDGL
jgi:hypothetical protein